MPLTGSQKAIMFAQSGVERSGASRTGYHSAKLFIAINGVQYAFGRATAGKAIANLKIEDRLNDTPNTAAFDVVGVKPSEGSDVVVMMGSMNTLVREFAGQILNFTQTYDGKPANYRRRLSAIDYTWGLNKTLVLGHYTGSATVIAQELVSTYAPNYTLNVEDGLETIEGGITFTNESLPNALTRLCKRFGGAWKSDYHRVIYLGTTAETQDTPPQPLVDSLSTLLLDDGFTFTHDLSQVLTRVYVEGGGAATLSDIPIGETILPLVHVEWYQVDGGIVQSGPQRLTYTGKDEGGGGALVGPGAAPSGGPTAVLANGAGVEDGLHDYAVSLVTAAGETNPGPRTPITVAPVSPPVSAPTPGLPTAGATGPDAGTHDYAVTFVTPAGETPPGPLSGTVTTGFFNPPASAPTGSKTVGTGLQAGTYIYGTTFSNAAGQTTIGPSSSGIVTEAAIANPATFNPLPYGSASGGVIAGNLASGTYSWRFTYVHGAFGTETLPSPASSDLVWTQTGGQAPTLVKAPAAPPGYVTQYYRTTNGGGTWKRTTVATVPADSSRVYDDVADGNLGANAPAANNTAQLVINLANIAIGPTGTTSRSLYRTVANGGSLGFLVTLSDNVTTTYPDSIPDVSLGGAPPSTNTAAVNVVPITNIPLGPPIVTQRKIYRRSAGQGLKLAATLANNTATTHNDVTTNASLGAAAPTVNTATANRVQLSAIPLGPSGTTARKVWRTITGGGQLKLLVTLSDNTTQSSLDSTPDGSLGANAPTGDTSGLVQPPGQVNAGSSTLIVANPAAFRPDGGWVITGNQPAIRYTGISGNTLTGIPTSGLGSIVASLSYNTTVTAAPCIIGIPSAGIGSVTYAISLSEDVNILAVVNDTAAQAVLSALLSSVESGPHDGVIEEFLQDRRLSFDEATARGEALLDLRSAVAVRIHYRTRDRNTRSGQTISVNLAGEINITEDFTIQQVTHTYLETAQAPLYSVQASNERFTLEQLLALVRDRKAA